MVLIASASALLVGAVSFFGPAFLKSFEPKKTTFVHLDHPAKKASFWKQVSSRPLERRIIEAPPMLIDYVTKDNADQGWPNQPRSMKVDDGFKHDLLKALMTLPKPVLDEIEPTLAFISVVKDLGGTGYTDWLVDDQKDFDLHSFIVLDFDMLQRRANEWATWKENSPFKPDGVTQLTATIEESSSDDRVQAIQYILLHELGHVVSFSNPEFPRFDAREPVRKDQIEMGFPRESWEWSSDGAIVSLHDPQFAWRGHVHYYSSSEKQKPISEAPGIYTDLAKTNFPTLYASTNFNDDFADSFASFVHTELQNKPWEIRIEQPGREPQVYASCWREERCKKKRLVLEAILGL